MFGGQAEDALTFFRDTKNYAWISGRCSNTAENSLESVSLMAAPSGAALQK